MKKLVSLTTLSALFAAPAALALSGAASAAPGEKEKRGTCAGAPFELSVDRDDGGYEVSADLDRATPGSRWTLTLTHDGVRATKLTRTADAEGDVELESYRSDTAGSDTFVLKLKPAGAKACTARVAFA